MFCDAFCDISPSSLPPSGSKAISLVINDPTAAVDLSKTVARERDLISLHESCSSLPVLKAAAGTEAAFLFC